MSLWDSILSALQGMAQPTPGVVVPTAGSYERTQETAFEHMVACCEGTDGPDGYRMLFGGKLFDSYADHPRIGRPFTNSEGVTQFSTAAGRYQINVPTWDTDIQPALHLPDFGPESQDRAALYLMTISGALDYIHAGQLQAAIDRCGGRWASLPSSRYPQPRRTYQFCVQAFLAANGRLS